MIRCATYVICILFTSVIYNKYVSAKRATVPINVINEASKSYLDLSKGTLGWVDETGTLEISELLNSSTLQDFLALDSIDFSDRTQVYWIYFKIKNSSHLSKNRILNIGRAAVVDLYLVQRGKVNWRATMGESRVRTREMMAAERLENVVPLTIGPGATLDIYVRMASPNQDVTQPQPALIEQGLWHHQFGVRYTLQAAFLGVLLAIGLLGLLLFIFRRKERAMLHYALYAFCGTIYFTWYFGFVHNYINPGYPGFNAHLWTISIFLPGFYMQFIRSYLNLKEQAPKWDRLFKALFIGSIIMFLLINMAYALTNNYRLVDLIVHAYNVINITSMLVYLYQQRGQKEMSFRLISIGTSVLSIFALYGMFLMDFKLQASGAYWVEVGIIAQLLILGVGLASKQYESYGQQKRAREFVIDQLKDDVNKAEEDHRQLNGELNEKTDRLMEVEEELEIKLQEVEKVNTELTHFLYAASHDLKTPLRGISTISDLLERDYGNMMSEEGKEHLQLLKSRSLRMDSLIEGLLNYAKVCGSNATRPVEVGHLVDKVMEPYRENDNGVMINGVKDVMVNAVPNDLLTLFDHLIQNAVRFSGEDYHVEVRAEHVNGHHIFTVTDQGPGIDPQYHQKVFEIFETLDHDYQSQHVGIGLALVAKIVKHQRGRIWIENPDVGCKFCLTLEANTVEAPN